MVALKPEPPYILVTGLSGSGKTTVSGLLSRFLNSPTINVGDCLVTYLKERKIEPQNRAKTGSLFLEHFGDIQLFRVVVSCAREHHARIVDGVRLLSTGNFFKKTFKSCVIVYVESDDEIRRQRLANRLGHSERNFETVKEEYAADARHLKEIADYVIIGQGLLVELEQRVQQLSAQIMAAY